MGKAPPYSWWARVDRDSRFRRYATTAGCQPCRSDYRSGSGQHQTLVDGCTGASTTVGPQIYDHREARKCKSWVKSIYKSTRNATSALARVLSKSLFLVGTERTGEFTTAMRLV